MSEYTLPKLSAEAVQFLVDEHIERYPEMAAQDFYKLAWNACGGGGEDEVFREIVRLRLMQEISELELEAKAWEDPLEILHEEAGVGRVHLRAYLRAGGSMERLVDALVATREKFSSPGIDAMGVVLGTMRAELAARDDHKVVMSDFDALLREKIAEGLPEMEHSARYIENYDPHYVVILTELLG